MKSPPEKPQHASRILLVDDNDHGLIARKRVLEELGYRVCTAKNGEEAFEFFTTGQFDLIVTDYKMPKMSGLELIRKVKRIDPVFPMILLSAFVEPLGLDEQATGADAVLAKSASEVPLLIRAVSRLAGRKTPKKSPGAQTRPALKVKSV